MISFLNFAVLTSGLLLLIVAYIGIVLSLEPPEVAPDICSIEIKKAGTEAGFFYNGGEGGIRTLEQFDPLHAFQACSFSHSDTSPKSLVMQF